MDITQLTVDRAEADRLWRKYKEHRAYSQPIDWEVTRAYQLLRKGRLIIKALQSIVDAGLNDQGLPRLALAGATWKTCHLTRHRDGSCEMSAEANPWRRSNTKTIKWRAERFKFPVESFPLGWWNKAGQGERLSSTGHKAQVPLVPIHLRPQRGLANYHVLFEAEWTPEPPRDPYLLRRIGKADLWLVVAQWDLTEVERAALSTRVVP
jgi:hypothetical protein